MKTRLTILSMTLLLSLSSCERFLEVELPDQDPKIVLNALLQPNDTLKVFLSKSRSVLDGNEYDEFELIKNGKVVLKDQRGNSFPLEFVDKSRPYEQNAYYYLPNPELRQGENYELIAESPGFKTITSSQRFPEFVPIKNVEIIDLGPNGSSDNQNLFEIILKFDDLPGRNYYEISGNYFGKEYYVIDGDTTFYYAYSELYPVANNPALNRDFQLKNVLLFGDAFLNGKDSEIAFKTSLRRGMDLDLTVVLSHVTDAYYQYSITSDLQYYNRGDFLSQPVLVYNNINNGLGIFQAKNLDQRVIQIRVE